MMIETNRTADPTAEEAQAFIAQVRRLTQYWLGGLLSDEEYEAATSELFVARHPALQDYENAPVPLD